MLDLQYHDIRSASGLFRLLEAKGEVERLLDPMEIEEALLHPPSDTRAFFRGTLLRRFPSEVVAASWSSVVVDDGSPSLKRIPLTDPFRGTQKSVGAIIDRAQSAKQLLDGLLAKGGPSGTSEDLS